MEKSEVKARICSKLSGADVAVEGADCSFAVRVISSAFAGLSLVKRQQLVFACFDDVLADGRLHALTIHAHTPQEWEARMGTTLTNLIV